jgi:hypothetical protein
VSTPALLPVSSADFSLLGLQASSSIAAETVPKPIALSESRLFMSFLKSNNRLNV